MKNLLKIPKNSKYLLILILLLTAFLRLYRLDYPKGYVFDEVYHAYTAKEYLALHKEAWEWWTTPPPGVAYEWTHPPLAKEIMTISMFILHTTDSWAWRLPGSLLGILSVYLVYLLGIKLFNKNKLSLLAAFIFSIDGLNFVQSRIGMNDIYYVTFVLLSLLFFLNRRFFISAVFFGLAISSKWAAVYLIILYTVIMLYKKDYTNLLIYFCISPIIYLISYIPFFLMGHNFGQFIQLHQQMWWYHTNLKAIHTYSSPWWSWPLNLYPVWYFVDYQKNTTSNIFASGNPVIFWLGSATFILTLIEWIKKRAFNLLIVVLGILIFWLPWALSPRIMFLYHFSPTLPFLSLSLAYQLNMSLENSKGKQLVAVLLILMTLCFFIIYPFLTGVPIPKSLLNYFS